MTFIKNTLSGACTLFVLASLQVAPVKAQGIDPLIEGAKLCTRYLQRFETEYGIPAHLLSAIASTESGRYHEGLRIKLPWPWTINAEGKGYYFNSKDEALAAAHKFHNQGVKSMDVGCMQVNLHHHADAFSSFSQAFEPENNVAYAASFLRSLYQESGSWKEAAADYHSKTPYRGSQYVGRVYDSWFKIVDKLRAAKLSVPASSDVAMGDMKQVNPVKTARIEPKHIDVEMAQNQTDLEKFRTPKMRTIKVTSSGSVARDEKAIRQNKDNGIIIVRPEISVVSEARAQVAAPVAAVQDNTPAPEPMVMADASLATPRQSVLDAAPVSSYSNNPQAKIIRVDDKSVDTRSVNPQVIKKSGPNFIFND